MTETEQAIKEYDILIKGYEDDLFSDRYSDIVKEEFKRQRDIFLIGREALKEKAEREKGCEWCDDHNYKQPSEWIWGERIHIIKPHYFCVGDGIAHYEEAEYCPKCGKRLVSKNDIE